MYEVLLPEGTKKIFDIRKIYLNTYCTESENFWKKINDFYEKQYSIVKYFSFVKQR